MDVLANANDLYQLANMQGPLDLFGEQGTDVGIDGFAGSGDQHMQPHRTSRDVFCDELLDGADESDLAGGVINEAESLTGGGGLRQRETEALADRTANMHAAIQASA